MGKSKIKIKGNDKNSFLIYKSKQNETHVVNDKCIASILDNIKSATPERRLYGLQGVADVASGSFDERCQELFDSGIIRLAGPLLHDNDISIRRAAAGAIRNLSTLSKECINKLVEDDIMTPLISLFQLRYSKEWKPYTVKEKEKNKDKSLNVSSEDEKMQDDQTSTKEQPKEIQNLLDEKTDTFVQNVHILWNICESNSDAVRIFNQADILHILVPCLNPKIYPSEVTLAVGQCLNTISEDNSFVKSKLLKYSELIESLLTHPGDSPEDVFLRVLVAGLASNLELNHCSLSALKCIENALSIDNRKAVLQVTNCLATTEIDNSEESTLNLNKEIILCRNILDAQILSLELLANMCLPTDDQSNEDPMDGDWSSSSSTDDINEDVTAVDKSYYPEESKELLKALAQAELPKLVLERSKPLAENEYQILKHHPNGHAILEKTNELRCRSFYCINNLILELDLEYLGDVSALYNLCIDLTKFIIEQKEENPKILEAVSVALTGALRRFISLNDKSCLECFKSMTEEDIKALEEALLRNTESNIVANLIRIIGLYGQICFYTNSPNFNNLIKAYGISLLELASRQEDLWLLSEALDSIMYIFGEDETDQVAKEIQLVNHLKSLHSTFKHKFRLKKKQRYNQPHQDIISTVNANLMRFIKYKSERI